MSIEAMKQALEALENSQRFVEVSANAKMLHGWGEQLDTAEDAITSLRQAIAEAEKQEQGEPVALPILELDGIALSPNVVEQIMRWGQKCASTPQQRTWVGLTNEEIFETHKQVDSMQYLTFGKAIEAKLKEKNK